MKRLLAALLCSFAMQVGNAQTPAPILPTEVELKASYCIAVTQNLLAMLQASPEVRQNTPDQIANSQTTLGTLQLYLMPRLPYLDPMSVAAAYQAGENDHRRFSVEAGNCNRACVAVVNGDIRACILGCANTASALKVRSCTGAAFLPF